MLLRRAAQLPPRRRPLLGVSLRRWARLCPAVHRMERLPVQAAAGRPSRRTPEANEPHTPCRCGARDASPIDSSHTFVTSSGALACSHMHTSKSHAHDRHLSTHTSVTPSHARTCPGVNGHVDTLGGRLMTLASSFPRVDLNLKGCGPQSYIRPTPGPVIQYTIYRY